MAIGASSWGLFSDSMRVWRTVALASSTSLLSCNMFVSYNFTFYLWRLISLVLDFSFALTTSSLWCSELRQLQQLQRSSHRYPRAKQSQYYFRHLDLMQLQTIVESAGLTLSWCYSMHSMMSLSRFMVFFPRPRSFTLISSDSPASCNSDCIDTVSLASTSASMVVSIFLWFNLCSV